MPPKRMNFASLVALCVCLVILGHVHSAQSADYDLQLYVTMAPQQITLDSGFVKRHVDSVVYLNVEYDTVFHLVAVDTVEYYLPAAVMRTGIWGQPSPKGVPKPNYDNDFILTFSSEAERDSALAVLSAEEGVVSVVRAEPFVVDNTCPDDDLFTNQWSLYTSDCFGGSQSSHIGATEAWNYSVGDSAMIIAVIDLGVQSGHEDFQIPGGGSKVFGDASYSADHGTKVAGVIAAGADNSIGLAGVNWKARILAKNATGDPGKINASKAEEKIIEAVDEGAVVINNSWGGHGDPPRPYRALNYAYQNDVVTTASSGNGNNDSTHWPSSHPGVISIGSHTSSGARSSFSNYGAGIDLVAPGSGIQLLDTDPQNPYTSGSGTSFSAPHVAGAASLLRSYMPNLSNDDVKSLLEISAKDDQITPGYDPFYGHGMLRLDSAFRMLQSPNTLRQLAVISQPSVHSVSGTYACPFYGAPGLATNVYFVKKYEVRAAVTFPNPYYHLAGAWGRGNSTTGFTGDTTNFGIGFAEFVPGTVTTTGGTIRTYVYEMWNLAGGYVGFRPCAPANVSFEYSALGELVLATPGLTGTVQSTGNHRLTWPDALTVESNWHVDRKEGTGSWQIDFAVLSANSTSFTDSAAGLVGSELYQYRIYPSTPNQTGSNSNVVSLRAKPKAPTCVSGYVVQMNTLVPSQLISPKGS